MTALMLSLTSLFILAAGGLYWNALQSAWPLFPPHLQDPHGAGFAIDSLIWNRSIPSAVRRKYVASLALASGAFGCASLAALMAGHRALSFAFAALFFLALAYTLTRLMKLRDRM